MEDHRPKPAPGPASLRLWLERGCLVLGTSGLLLVTAVFLDGWLGYRAALAAFDAPAAPEARPGDAAARAVAVEPAPGMPRASATRGPQADVDTAGGAIALLRIPRLDVTVPVFPGTDRRTLNRGAGLVEGTARPGARGNSVISAHRDSFFRPLKDIALDDRIEVVDPQGTLRGFRVAEIFITDPLDVSVLEATDSALLTLITCFPFNYVGFAPDRLIVRATPVPADRS
jgi:sortase A